MVYRLGRPCLNQVDGIYKLRELLPRRDEFNAAKQLKLGDALLSLESDQRFVENRTHAVGAPHANVL